MHIFKDAIYENKVVFHYKLPLSDVNPFRESALFENKIYFSMEEIPQREIFLILHEFGPEKIDSFEMRFGIGFKMVASYLAEELASFCFFSDFPFKFRFFYLPHEAIYFFDCFTFENFRGLGAVHSEVAYVIDKYSAYGFKEANVEIESSNASSIKAFSKIGFEKTEEYHYTRFLFFKRVKEVIL